MRSHALARTALACLFGLLAQAGEVDFPRGAGTVDVVRGFGAVADGRTDCTRAFQKALDGFGSAGGTVLVPPGRYAFTGHLVFPPGVALQGSWVSVPSHNGFRDPGLPKATEDGTTFLVTEGRGDEAGPPFITLNSNGTLKGVVLYWPLQKPDAVPEPYPWAVAMRGKNPAVVGVELLNPYNGIDASLSERSLIRDVVGQPLRRGIFVDRVYDICRIEDVHFNPWWSMSPKLYGWQQEHGEAFLFERSDWQYVTNTFCFGYRVGYRFSGNPGGACNGSFLGIGADDCWTAVQVDQAYPMGLLITNGEFTAFHGPDPTMVDVGPGHTGLVRFVNCAFWGPCRQIARIGGQGTVAFSDCTFQEWDAAKEGRAALQAETGTILVRGCSFQQVGNQVQLGKGVRRAVVSGNAVCGPVRIGNEAKGQVYLEGNVGSE